MLKQMILGIARHVLTAAGAWLTAGGLAAMDDVNAAIGAAIALVGFAWSIWDKKTATD